MRIVSIGGSVATCAELLVRQKILAEERLDSNENERGPGDGGEQRSLRHLSPRRQPRELSLNDL
jgi:hypothetical protein